MKTRKTFAVAGAAITALFVVAQGCGSSTTGSGFENGDNDGGGNGGDGGSHGGDGSIGLLGDSGTPDAGPCDPATDGLQCQIAACPGGGHTTLSGQVFDPAGKNALYNVVVYVPNHPEQVQPIPDNGASCDKCDALYTGQPLVATLTGPDGKFTLSDVPVGQNIPLIIQVGKWRRQLTVPSITQCADNPMPKAMTTLPSKKGQGADMPKIAVSTGGADSLECLLRRIGIDNSEFVGGAGGNQRVHIYQGHNTDGDATGQGLGDGPSMTGSTYSDSTLWNNTTTLKTYDIVIMSCEGTEDAATKPAADITAMQAYADTGGRVFASHYHYYWFNNNPAWAPQATWIRGPNPNTGAPSDVIGFNGSINADINTGFPKGKDFKTWLGNVGALQGGTLPIQTARHNADTSAANAGTEPWIWQSGSQTVTQYLTFNTPVTAQPDSQCGRVVFSDLHVGGAGNDYGSAGKNGITTGGSFPSGCQSGDLSPQEKALEFMLFDLSSCVQPDNKPPTPPPPVR